jgi:hypothetical protein
VSSGQEEDGANTQSEGDHKATTANQSASNTASWAQKQHEPNPKQYSRCKCLQCANNLLFLLISPFYYPVRWFTKLQQIDKFTFIVAVFTVILAAATCIQVWAFIQSERAFVTIAAFNIEGGPLSSGKQVSITIRVINPGKGVGIVTDLRAILDIRDADKELPVEPEYGHADESVVPPIPSGAAIPRNFEFYIKGNPGGALTEKQVTEINSGHSFMRIYGYIEYTDDFWIVGNRRFGYCAIYNPKGTPSMPLFNVCIEKAYTYVK